MTDFQAIGEMLQLLKRAEWDLCNRNESGRAMTAIEIRQFLNSSAAATIPGLFRAGPLIGREIGGRKVRTVGGFNYEGERLDFESGPSQWLSFAEIDSLIEREGLRPC